MSTSKKTFKKACFIILLLGMTFTVTTAFASPEAGSLNAATEKLFSAVVNPHATTEEITRLIQEGADVNAVNKYEWTSLYFRRLIDICKISSFFESILSFCPIF